MSYMQMAQLEVMNAAANVTTLEDLNAAANVTTLEDLNALRMTLSRFFAERAQRAVDRLWDEGKLNQAKLDELRGQHLRTPYN